MRRRRTMGRRRKTFKRRRSSTRKRKFGMMRSFKRRSWTPTRMPRLYGFPSKAKIRLYLTTTRRMGNGTSLGFQLIMAGAVTNANITVSLRNLFNPLLAGGAVQPTGFFFWTGLYNVWRALSVRWTVRWTIADATAVSVNAVTVTTGETEYDMYSTWAPTAASPWVPTNFNGLDSALAAKNRNQLISFRFMDRNTAGWLASNRIATHKDARWNNMPAKSRWVPLGKRPRGLGNQLQDTPTGPAAFSTSNLTYPNYYAGNAGGAVQPYAYDRRIVFWAYSNALGTGAAIQPLPAVVLYYTCAWCL